ncbi:UpxY family transcription antiterminator [Aquimarina sp. Aq78]|uniref:UpxY family transcription antiterminator n=1 Tax=Aquimarina sp. Aq78 TaxID=1191889 RepID=UPI000D10F14E|nr:UpxY family transcription antiterminator [Aquimarina sp. Aq78]
MCNSKPQWYVLYVKARHERKIEILLKENQIETFLPLVKTVRKWSDRKKEIEMPLFPSYIFVKINLKKDAHKVLSVRLYCFFIRFGEEFAKVQEYEIDSIKLLIKMNVPMKVENYTPLLKVGKHGRINGGVLKGLNCEIIKADNENKIVVRIDSIKQNIVATVPLSSISEVAI